VIHHVGGGDPGLDPYRHVGDHTWLAERRLFVAEGRLVVERLLDDGRHEIESIVVTPAACEALGTPLLNAPCDVYVCERGVLESITGFNFHRGCLALARRPKPHAAEELAGARRLLALEGVGNPDNVGGIFRTAAALGADGVLLDPASGDPLYRKAIRTSMGATLRVPWVRVDAFPQSLEPFLAGRRRLVALTPDPAAIDIHDFAATVSNADLLMFLLGAEGPGLNAATLTRAHVLVRIPVTPEVDSLNVAVAAAIALDRLR
jgi:tRNA G18 (ribose-2'-O)-methylase SpoU